MPVRFFVSTPVIQPLYSQSQMIETIATSEAGGKKGKKAEAYGLIPPHPLEEVARVYGYGSSKYTSKIKSSCSLLTNLVQLEPCENIPKLLSAIQTEGTPLGGYVSSAIVRDILRHRDQIVIQTGLENLADSVVLAMIEDLKKQILNITKDKRKIRSDGQDLMEITGKNTLENTGQRKETKREQSSHQEESNYTNLDFLRNPHLRFLLTKMDVPFATLLREDDITISTMTMILENLEDSFAVDATKDWVFSEITKLVFPLLSNTCGLSLIGDNLVNNGEHNWTKGYNYTWSLGALHRHIKEFEKGISKDGESGVHHLAHAAFHLFALMEFERTGRGTDDRVIKQYE